MSEKRFNQTILPVMFGFFIMGFVDIVGVATNYVKADFAGMNDKVAGLISLSCFLWFLILSIPTGMLMNKIGRKKTTLRPQLPGEATSNYTDIFPIPADIRDLAPSIEQNPGY